MSKVLRSCCFRFSTILLAAGLQCYAYAGFAVNVGSGDPAAIYESPTTLVTKIVSKQQAVEFYNQNKEKYAVVFSYDLMSVAGDQTFQLEDASPNNSFCINPYTRKIGVAVKAKDAMALTQARPQVFYVVAGETLSNTVARWSKEQGCSSQWASPNDFTIQFSYAFYGSFQVALDELLKSIATSSDGFAVKATITKNCVVVFKPNDYRAEPVTGIF